MVLDERLEGGFVIVRDGARVVRHGAMRWPGTAILAGRAGGVHRSLMQERFCLSSVNAMVGDSNEESCESSLPTAAGRLVPNAVARNLARISSTSINGLIAASAAN